MPAQRRPGSARRANEDTGSSTDELAYTPPEKSKRSKHDESMEVQPTKLGSMAKPAESRELPGAEHEASALSIESQPPRERALSSDVIERDKGEQQSDAQPSSHHDAQPNEAPRTAQASSSNTQTAIAAPPLPDTASPPDTASQPSPRSRSGRQLRPPTRTLTTLSSPPPKSSTTTPSKPPARTRPATKKHKPAPAPAAPSTSVRRTNKTNKKWDPIPVVTATKSPLAQARLLAVLRADMAWTALTPAQQRELVGCMPAAPTAGMRAREAEMMMMLQLPPLPADGGAAGEVAEGLPNVLRMRLEASMAFKADVRQFQEELAQGKLEVGWIELGMRASARRSRGEFDEWKIRERENAWAIAADHET